jgi:hypothetical protein
MRNAFHLAAVAGVAVGLAGCPSETCDLESPQVSALPSSCTQVASQPVSYPVRLCPTCNQFGATCDVTISGNEIFVDTKVEACEDSSTCGGPACEVNATTCEFTAPATPGTYAVIAFDGLTGQPREGDLFVIAGGDEFCDLPVAGR